MLSFAAYGMEDRNTKDMMKLARKMMVMFTDCSPAESKLKPNGWLDFTTYESLEYAKDQLRHIVLALQPFFHEYNSSWEWRIFGNDGLFACHANGDGSRFEDDDCQALFDDPVVTPQAQHPPQPLTRDHRGIIRFKKNAIVQHLMDAGGITLNDLALLPFSDEDRSQFAQLLGYSLCGWGDLSYVSDAEYSRAVPLESR